MNSKRPKNTKKKVQKNYEDIFDNSKVIIEKKEIIIDFS
jgi:hypothetical protein